MTSRPADYGEPGRGGALAGSMVIAVEPMVNAARPEVAMRGEWLAAKQPMEVLRRISSTPWRLRRTARGF